MDTRSNGHSESLTAPASPALRAIVQGLFASVVMWCLWFVLHLPGLEVSPKLAGPILLGAMLGGLAAIGAGNGPTRALRVGLISGLTISLIALLLLGSIIVEQPEPGAAPAQVDPGAEGLKPGGGLAMAGFLAFGTIVGGIAGWLGGRLAGEPRHPIAPRAAWLARSAYVTAFATFPLILIGGFVTSTESGLAVPDWPTTYGANMFLFPVGLMTSQDVFLEHSHRLFGTLVGIATLIMGCAVAIGSPKRGHRIWASLLVVFVIVQGVIGGIRVTNVSTPLAMVHGITGQLFLVLTVGLAVALTPAYQRADKTQPGTPGRKVRRLATAALHATVLQLVLGAATRHFAGMNGGTHALWTHAGFSLVVVVFTLAAGFALSSLPKSDALRTARRAGRAMVILVALQFLLGLGAFMTLSAGDETAPAGTIDIGDLIATLHQANGALLIGATMIGWMWSRRLGEATES